jgi:acyl dehydratase
MQGNTRRAYSPELEQALVSYRENIGKITHLGTEGEIFGRRNESACKSAIRHFTNGIGDSNPLWRDAPYAGKTRYSDIIAPPMFVNAIALAMGGSFLPGFIHFIAGGEWEWQRTIHLDDSITVTDTPVDIIDKSRPDGTGPMQFLQIGKMVYRNQKDEIVAECKRMTMSVDHNAMTIKESGSPAEPRSREIHRYSQDELAAINKAYDEEEIRGGNIRYWEDVKEGEPIRHVVKGPLTHGDMLAFIAGVGWMDEAHGIARSQFKKYGPVVYHDPETGINEWSFAAHFVDRIGQGMGMKGANNLGIQTACWLGHLMTNWMGDDGFLKKLSLQCRQIIYLGDTIWCRGKVIGKYVESGDHLVECEISAENHIGQVVAPGRALVVLPSKTSS